MIYHLPSFKKFWNWQIDRKLSFHRSLRLWGSEICIIYCRKSKRPNSRLIFKYTLFFISNAFFNSASLLLDFIMNWALDVARFCYRGIVIPWHVIFCIFISVSTFRSICLIYVFIIIIIFVKINHIISLKQTNLFLVRSQQITSRTRH